MEKLACDIEKMLQDKLSLFQELKKTLEQEKKYIVDMNIDSLWKTVEKKKQIASEIVQIRGRILSLFEEEITPLETSSFSLTRIINILPFPAKIKSDLKRIKIELELVKDALTDLVSENKRYTNQYLSVINGIFVAIVGAENKKAYNNAGKVLKEDPLKTLIRIDV